MTADSHRIAAIDIGTVTARLLIADVSGRDIEVLVRDVAITQLGEGLVETGRLCEAAMERVCSVVKRYQAKIASYGVARTVAIATAAARDADNADVFCNRLKAEGIDLSIIAGQQEATLSFLGAASQFPGDATLVVDIGGGSTEVVLGAIRPEGDFYTTDILASHSFQIGCRRVTDLYLTDDPPSQEQLAHASTAITTQMSPLFNELAHRPEKMVAVAGTATSVVAIELALAVYDSARVHGVIVSRQTLDALLTHLAGMTLAKRRQVIGLDPGRAGIIVAGLVILTCVLSLCGLDSFTVSESDILQGILLDTARRM